MNLSSVKSTVELGRKLNSARCHEKPKSLARHDETKCARKCEEKVWKIQFPFEMKKCFPCNHHNGFVIDRNLLTLTDHIDLLSQPRKVKQKLSLKFLLNLIFYLSNQQKKFHDG
jgi:hypothetical protein